MELANSQQDILQRLKTRGPQSVKILASQLGMTTMGVRQHLAELRKRGLVEQTQETRQTRGRPVHLWKLTGAGHRQFPDGHAQVTLELIETLRIELGPTRLDRLIDARSQRLQVHYERALDASGPTLEDRVTALTALRNEEGFMAEVRLLPDGWLLIENHCPVCAAAKLCQQFCRSELDMFRSLLANYADVERVDHLFAGARRCAYKIIPNQP
ncbi:MAG: transcriptional regulator [Pseudohongiellaceae bacterium]|jgi:predicted ArsR family transcriptional regulator